jgi:ribosomal protein L24
VRNNEITLFDECYSDEEITQKKVEAFDKIAKLFYNCNFGTATKSEIDLLMFSILMDAMIDKYSMNGILDYKACSDYNIGIALGIQPSKVTLLKKNKQARYRKEFEWQKSLQQVKEGIRRENKKIIIPMPDPNLYIEIKHFIEERNGYIEIQRGENIMIMRPEYFFMMLYYGVDSEEEQAQIRKKTTEFLRRKEKMNEADSIQTDDEINSRVLELGESTFDLLESVAEGISNPLIGIIKCLKLGTKLLK